MGSSYRVSLERSEARVEEASAEEEAQRAERLGAAWLQRYRRIEGSSLLPSVEPLNELLLSLDFFADLREEDSRALLAEPKDEEAHTKVESSVAEAEAGASNGVLQEEDPEEEALLEERQSQISHEAQPAGEGVAESYREIQKSHHLRAIPTVIKNERQYVGFFLPLFLQEAKQAIARAIKLDLGPPEEFVQLSGEPSGPFLSLLLSRSGGAAATPAAGCKYCHGDLVLLYIPASTTTMTTQETVHDDGSASACPRAAATEGPIARERQKEHSVGAAGGSEGEEAERDAALASARPLRVRDTDCHVLGVVAQGQHETVTVKVLTPSLGHMQQSSPMHADCMGNAHLCSVYSPVTGRPEGYLLPRDKRRMIRLAKALNAQSTSWTVHRLMSLTTLHREFQRRASSREGGRAYAAARALVACCRGVACTASQGLMALPDIPLKASLFRVPAEGGAPPRKCLGNKLKTPLHNPLLEGVEDAKEASESAQVDADARLADPQVGAAMPEAPAEPPASLDTQRPSSGASGEAPYPERRLVIPESLRTRLESLYNASQLAALEDSLKVEGVTLIQGPPGTGKTSTIVGVVSVILHAQLQGQQISELAPQEGKEHAEESKTEESERLRAAASRSSTRTKSCPWLQPGYLAWMDADEVALEDLDCQLMLQPAAVPTEPPICLARKRHELQPVRILVCAPSNAAIDEIVKRLTADPEAGGGIFDGNGERFSPAVVRVGPNVHPDLLQHSLQYKALQRLKARGVTNFAALAAAKADVLRESVIVCATISVCGSTDLTSLAECFDTVVVDEASQAVELATLIPLRLGCRRLILVGDPKQLPATIFSRVAIQLRYDRSLFQRLEGAGQSTNMLSQQYRMHPTISRFASIAFYEGLLRDAAHLPSGLWTPFPSWHRLPILQPLVFFNIDSEHMVSRLTLQENGQLFERTLGLARLWNRKALCGSGTPQRCAADDLAVSAASWEDFEEHTSLVNYVEADFVRQLVDFLRRLVRRARRRAHALREFFLTLSKRSPDICTILTLQIGLLNENGPLSLPVAKPFLACGHSKWEHRLAVISPYAQQVILLRRTIKALLGISDGKSCPVDVNTVDGFQGQEKDFIIFSAVRGIRSDTKEAKKGTVGFLGDMRRLNVAVTRGRVNLWLVGNGCFLRRDKTWARLYAYAKDRQALISLSRRNAQHSAILTKWVVKYCKTRHHERKLLEEHAPRFLADLTESLKAMRERKQKRGAKEDEDQGDELQTEGQVNVWPVSWEVPLEDSGVDEGTKVGEMRTFHDVVDDGCLDEVAVHLRDEALKNAAETENPQAPEKADAVTPST
ncbi:tRNA-splicing endonuclease positive effector [Cyclospora cayetanensis]|uniref:tRNA-splicing endonuclease positive effector n=1 Tax=Cyclospora cayetanensis TaxID=88456 RepID=A0A1D3CQU5_9EIME|nr:tRNA-splicing endonuclease positive effector [Cyclospora cayetanensis]